MAREDRKKITPEAACRAGGIHVWTNAVTNCARTQKCHSAIPRSTAPGVVKPEPMSEPENAEQALAAQHKLADIIYQWTDPEQDWADAFGMLDPNADDLGTQMFSAILMKYQAESAHDVTAQRHELNEGQRSEENLVAYFRRISRAQQRLRQAERPVPFIDFLDIFKTGVSQPHKLWTSYLKASDFDMDKLKAEVYDKGGHIDGPTDATGAGAEKAAFPAKKVAEDQSDDLANKIATEVGRHVAAALAARPAAENVAGRRRRSPKRGRGRNGGGGGKDYSEYTCHYCHKQGHISRDCSQKRRDQGDNNDNDEDDNQQIEEEHKSIFICNYFLL